MEKNEKRVLSMSDLRPGFNSNKKCLTCEHKIVNAGTHHVGCSKQNAIVNLNKHGVSNGWAVWPFSSDPIWIESCDSYFNKNQYDNLDFNELKIILTGNIKYLQEKVAALRAANRTHVALSIMKEVQEIFAKIEDLDFNEVTEETTLNLRNLLIDLSKI